MSTPKVQETQEVRFAVVMYGGVSLAIYINGVAQELLKMVRSTAKGENSNAKLSGAGLGGTERVYRKISYLLGDSLLADQYRQWAEQPAKPKETDPLEGVVKSDRVALPVRFIVDIISGTSAGGINGIFLAKALANDQQMDQLKKLWISEGDISLLINDKKSVEDVPLRNEDEPKSLLNSRRMYLKLLQALDGMEGDNRNPAQARPDSPNVDELDLFITATDIAGVLIPLRLSDTVVDERRHRSVFRFKYDSKQRVKKDVGDEARNEFCKKNNPFLAFAARCTSSFPFAFEPMSLADINEVVESFPGYDKCESESWKRFFSSNQLSDSRIDYKARAFGDGGYLDNKPFSYATETLMRRYSDVPVDRKLIYIEPSPEHPQDKPAINRKPDAIENVKAAILDLPGYETIREDLMRVLERNQLISRVNGIIRDIEQDMQKYVESHLLAGEQSLDYLIESRQERPRTGANWSELDLAEMVWWKGPYFLPYRRLRIASVTDELARLIARINGYDGDSSQMIAIRALARAWRKQSFGDYRGERGETVNEFLRSYDFKYRIRRLSFARNKIDRLYRFDAHVEAELRGLRAAWDELRDNERYRALDEDKKEKLFHAYPLLRLLRRGADLSRYIESEADKEQMRKVLLLIKGTLSDVFNDMRQRGRNLQSPDASRNPLADHIKNIGIEKDDLLKLLGTEIIDGERRNSVIDSEKCNERAEQFISDNEAVRASLKKAADKLRGELKGIFDSVRSVSDSLLNPNRQPVKRDGSRFNEDEASLMSSDLAKSVRGYLGYYYNNFDDYDQISFPIFYETDFGESDVIDVIRISPEDARSLVEERDKNNKTTGRKKLAGTSLHNFGAFFDRVWRQNDMMWGRLDGAERLVTAMLPDDRTQKAMRDALIAEAHEIILEEEMLKPDRSELCGTLAAALLRTSSGDMKEEAADRIARRLGSKVVKSDLEKALRASLTKERILEEIRNGYEVHRELEPQPTLRVVSRSTQVVGKMLEGISDSHNLSSRRVTWVARLGKIFWGMIEVAVPNSLSNLLFHNALKVLYLFEALMVIGGTLLGNDGDGVRKFGLLAFVATVGVNLAVLALRDLMRGRNRWLNIAIAVFGITFLLLAVMGGLFAWSVFIDEKLWDHLAKARDWVISSSGWRRWIPAAVVSLFFLLSIMNGVIATWKGLSLGRKKKHFTREQARSLKSG